MADQQKPTRKGKDKESYHVQSVDRALSILTCFELAKPELTLGEISAKTGLPKPTVFRLLSSLEAAKFVQRNPDNQHYMVGIRLFELGEIFQSTLAIEHIVTPHMQRITEKHDIVCNLGILDDGKVVYVASAEQGGPYRHAPILGFRHFIHCSALGKALVIDFPEEKIREIFNEWGMPSLSPHTLTTPDGFLDNLTKAREQGYTVDDQEGAVGILCLAVPIRNKAGDVVAAISVSGPSPKFSEEYKELILQDLLDTAFSVQRQL